MSYRELKRRIEEVLVREDMEGLSSLVQKYPRAIGALISLSYDKESLLTWRAIEAIGPVVKEITDEAPDAGRNIVRRLIWSITEESGGIGWSAVEMLGEIVGNSPESYSDLVPIITGLFDEEIFRTGVLYAICRIGERMPALLNNTEALLDKALIDKDPQVRGRALMTLQCLRRTMRIEVPEVVRKLLHDDSTVKLYCGGKMMECTIRELAEPLG